MKAKRALVIGGLVAALAIPAGAAGAAFAASTPSPSPSPSSGVPGGGPGSGYGRMMGGAGYGDPDDCPFHDSPQAQQWRADREQRQQMPPAERQNLIQQHREQMEQLMGAARP